MSSIAWTTVLPRGGASLSATVWPTVRGKGEEEKVSGTDIRDYSARSISDVRFSGLPIACRSVDRLRLAVDRLDARVVFHGEHRLDNGPSAGRSEFERDGLAPRWLRRRLTPSF